MKAKEYFAKYEESLISLDGAVVNKACSDLAIELMSEYKVIEKQRNIKTVQAFCGALKELNTKYIAICNLFEKKYGVPVLKYDGFRNVIEQDFPQLHEIWR